MRHPKACKNYFREGSCRFKEHCSYQHKKDLNQDILKQNDIEINAIKEEISKLKEIISLMQKQIIELNQEIQDSNKINVAEIVGLVVSLLDNSEASTKSSTTTNKNKNSIDCDICDF